MSKNTKPKCYCDEVDVPALIERVEFLEKELAKFVPYSDDEVVVVKSRNNREVVVRDPEVRRTLRRADDLLVKLTEDVDPEVSVSREDDMKRKYHLMASDPEGYFKDAYAQARLRESSRTYTTSSTIFSKFRHIFARLR